VSEIDWNAVMVRKNLEAGALRDALREIRDMVEDEMDADLVAGHYRPNQAMKIVGIVNTALGE
jgi:hypothetical protein